MTLQEDGCILDIKLFSGAVAEEVSVLEGTYLDLAIESFCFFFIISLVYKTKLKNGIEVASYASSF